MSGKFSKFVSYYKPYKKLIIADLFCALLTSGISILIPLIISHITGDLIGDGFITGENLKTILILIGVLALLLVVEYLKLLGLPYQLVAPTHKAKQVLSKSTDNDVMTVHQLLALKANINILDLDLLNQEAIKTVSASGAFITGNSVKLLFKYDSEVIVKALNERGLN